MKILISTDTYYPHVNGASYFTQRLAHYLQKKGHEILVIAPSTTFAFEAKNWNDVPVFGVPSFPVLSFGFRIVPPIAIQKRIEAAVFEFSPDIVHVQGHFTVSQKVIRAARKQRVEVPIVGTNHFMPENLIHYFHLPPYLEKKLMRYAWGKFLKTFSTLHGVSSPTQAAAAVAQANGFSKNIDAISCGVDLERFSPERADGALRKKYHLPNTPLLLFVGRLDKEKDIDVVLRAVAGVPNKVSLHFVIIGKGQESGRLKKLAHDLKIADRVTFLGFVPDDDLPALYALSDCFVNACTAELQCISAMEAMASGLPVLAANAVALPELVSDGKNGFLFEPKNSAELAKKIELMFTHPDLRNKMGQESLKIISRHAIEATIVDFERLYQRAAQHTTNENNSKKI